MLKGIVKFSQQIFWLNNLRYYLYRVAFKKRIKNFEKPILLFANARGGSTLLSNILVSSAECEEIFEPLNYKRFRCYGAKFKSDYRDIYMNANRLTITLQYVEDLLSGNTVVSYCKRRKSKRFVLKFINGKDSISILKKNLDAYFIYFLRDPIATCLSRQNWNWLDYNKRCFYMYRMHSDLFNDDQRFWIDRMKVERPSLIDFIIGWCIENHIGLLEAKINDVLIVSYEEMLLNPEAVIYELNSLFNGSFTIDSKLFKKRLRQPSESVSAYNGSKKSSFRIKSVLENHDEAGAINELLKVFNLSKYAILE